MQRLPGDNELSLDATHIPQPIPDLQSIPTAQIPLEFGASSQQQSTKLPTSFLHSVLQISIYHPPPRPLQGTRPLQTPTMGTKPLRHSGQKMLIIKLVEHISNKTNKNKPPKKPSTKNENNPKPSPNNWQRHYGKNKVITGCKHSGS